MERTNYQASNCSIARTLQVLGEKWTLLITRLVEEGILERSEYREPGSRARMEYRLTDDGRELMPILLALMQWGDRHKADPEGPPVLARHADCGRELQVAFACSKGHVVEGPDDVELVDGPGALPAVPA
jgi:DNA-binding HxlR family transcriptional regulator